MPIGINRTYSWKIGDFNSAAGSIYIIDEGGFPVEECILTGTTYTTAALQYEVNSGYKLTHIGFYDAHNVLLYEMDVNLTGSGQMTTEEIHPMTGGDYTVIVTPTFEEVPTSGGGRSDDYVRPSRSKWKVLRC